MNYINVIKDIINPFVKHKNDVEIILEEQKNLRDYDYIIYCNKEDLPTLIGRSGSIANSIREVANIAARIDHNRIRIRFEENRK